MKTRHGRRAVKCSGVAQLVAREALVLVVGGSNPSAGTHETEEEDMFSKTVVLIAATLTLACFIALFSSCAEELEVERDVDGVYENLTVTCKDMIVQGTNGTPDRPPQDVITAMAATRAHCGATNLNGCSASGTLCSGGNCQIIYSCPGGVANIRPGAYPDNVLSDLSCSGHNWRFVFDPSNWTNKTFKNATFTGVDMLDPGSRYGTSSVSVTSFGPLQNTWKVHSCLVKCAGPTGQC